MRAIGISMLTVLAQITISSLAIPVAPPSIHQNDLSPLIPRIPTRNPHDRRAPPPPPSPTVHARSLREASRCIPGTQTCVNVTINPPSATGAQRSIISLLSQALMAVHTHVEAHGDGDVPAGEAKWLGNDGVVLRVTNANNHQLTWGVLGGALQGVISVMGEGPYGKASFVIFDGPNQVGRGLIWV